MFSSSWVTMSFWTICPSDIFFVLLGTVTMAYNFIIGQTYSFNVYPSSLLGTDWQNVLVTSVMSYADAQNQKDVTSLHNQFYPFFGTQTNTPNDPASYLYIKVKTQNGDITILGVPWITDSTVVAVTAQTVTATIANVTPQDVPKIQAALVANGYNNVLVTIA